MNLYVTDKSPWEAARHLDDWLLVRACLDTAHLLSTALWRNHIWDDRLYRPDTTQQDNPSVVWTSLSRNNFRWVYHYGIALSDEYKFRWDHTTGHGSSVIIRNAWRVFNGKPQVFLMNALTEFPNTTPYKMLDTVKAYRNLLVDTKFNKDSVWTKREPPEFWKKLK